MKCEEFEDRVNDVLDQRGRPEWDAELLAHCQACVPCRELVGRYGMLLDGFYALATPEAPANLAARVLDDYRVRPSLARRASLVGALVATAAAVFFLVVPLAQAPRHNRFAAQPARPVALAIAGANELPITLADMDALPVVGPMIISLSDEDDATSPYTELAKGTGQGLASVVLYMPTIGGSPGMIGGGPGETAWPEKMSVGLKPVTDVVTETFGLLLDVLPSAGPAKRS